MMPNLLDKLGQLTQKDCQGVTFWVEGWVKGSGPGLTKEEIAFFDRDWLKAKAHEYFKGWHPYGSSSTSATYDKLFGKYEDK